MEYVHTTYRIDQKEYPEYYSALLARSSLGLRKFFVGVRSTGIFCRPECSARKPGFDRCIFFLNVQDSMLEGFRPCKRCTPLHPLACSNLLASILRYIEEGLSTGNLLAEGLLSQKGYEIANEEFKNAHGISLLRYLRVRDVGRICAGVYRFEHLPRSSRAWCMAPPSGTESEILQASAALLSTPIGTMIAIATSEHLYFLEYIDRPYLGKRIKYLQKKYALGIRSHTSAILEQAHGELNAYFEGRLTRFTIPIRQVGTTFQNGVWGYLLGVSWGETRNYSDVAYDLFGQNVCRAVGTANGMNGIAIVVPCHRMIRKDGSLGGYGGGVERKAWLLNHELVGRKE